jgi:hypothetical protein
MTSKTVKFLDGTYKLRGKDTDLSGTILPILEGYKVGVRGGYVTVDGKKVPGFPDRAVKVFVVDENSIEEVVDVVPIESTETDEEILQRMDDRFEMLNDMTRAVKTGAVRALIVSGPPGVGKSYGVEKVLSQEKLLYMLGKEKSYEVVKGAVSPLGLYCKLYNFSSKDNVLVFDDCDSIFTDETSLNLLKAALDSNKSRTLHWNSDSRKLRDESIPNSFQFDGSAIFITNVKFAKVRGRLREHIIALESRCHYIDLTIDTMREKLLLIKRIVQQGMLNDYKLPAEIVEEIVDFIEMNQDRLRELSLRTVLKIADLAKAFPNNWEMMAENTVMHRT